MEDKIRGGWLERISTLSQTTERVVDASKKRRHLPFVMNTTMRPIVISGLGPDINDNGITIKSVLTLGVLGEDDRCTAIQDITKYTDDELDNSSSYNSFLNRGMIKEVSQEEAKNRMNQATAYRNQLQNDAAMRQRVAMQRPMPSPAYNDPYTQQYFQQAQSSPIEMIDLDRSGGVFRPEENFTVPGVNVNRYDSMTEYYGDIYRK